MTIVGQTPLLGLTGRCKLVVSRSDGGYRTVFNNPVDNKDLHVVHVQSFGANVKIAIETSNILSKKDKEKTK